MARSRRRNRRSTSQNAASLLALALPAPLQRVANSQVGPLLMFFGVPALLVVGLLQIDWQNGTPHLSVNPQKATEIRQAVKGQLGNLENQPVFQQLEQTARNVWNGQFPNNSQSYPPQPQTNPQQQPTPPVYSTAPYAPQQQYSQQQYSQQQQYPQQPYPPSQRAQQQTWPEPNHGPYPQGSPQWSPSNGNSNPMASNRSTVGTVRAPFPSTNPPAGQYVSATSGANMSPYSQADSQARQPSLGQQQRSQQQNQQQLSQQQLYQQQLYQQQLYQQQLREQQQYPQMGEWPAQTPWQSR